MGSEMCIRDRYEPREPHGKKTKGPFLKRNVTSSYHSNRLIRLRQSTLLRSGGTCCDGIGAALFVPKMLLRESKSQHMECENQPTTPSEHVLCSAPVVVSPIRHCGWPSCPFLSPDVLVTKEWSPPPSKPTVTAKPTQLVSPPTRSLILVHPGATNHPETPPEWSIVVEIFFRGQPRLTYARVETLPVNPSRASFTK